MANDEAIRAEGRARSLAEVRALARILRQYDLTELEVETEDAHVVLKRELGRAPAALAQEPAPGPALATPVGAEQPAAVAAAAEPGGKAITSPFVGTFYRAASPDGPPFVEVGQTVRKGQTLCIVEAMKLMNEIEAEVDGKILEVLVRNGDPVEFGQPLFRVEPL